MKASGCIIAMNEEEYIERAIVSLQEIDIVDEIIVVDGGSSDRTVAICERLGCKVVVKPWQQDFSLQRNFAMSLCRNDWVICLDADEYYSKKAQYGLSKLLPKIADKFAAIRICEISELNADPFNTTPFDPLDFKKYVKDFSPQELITNGCVFQTGPNQPITVSYSYRVFNKTKGHWVNKIHEVFNIDPEYTAYVLPYEYVIHHQKSWSKQQRSDAKYFLLDNGESACVYNIDYDDFVNGQSQKSVAVLDEIFFKVITEIAPCDVFIEAGAFNGETSRKVQTIRHHSQVYAFEANPYNYNEFKPLFENTKVNYLHLAVSKEPGQASFKIHTDIQGTPLPRIKGNDSLLHRSEVGVTYEEVSLPAISLDGYFTDKIKDKDSVAMWIDLEGAAYQALEGAINIFPYVDVIKIEVEEHQYWENQKLAVDVKRFLAQFGFFPVLRDYEYPRQYNILFTKAPVITNQKFKELIRSYYAKATSGYFPLCVK